MHKTIHPVLFPYHCMNHSPVCLYENIEIFACISMRRLCTPYRLCTDYPTGNRKSIFPYSVRTTGATGKAESLPNITSLTHSRFLRSTIHFTLKYFSLHTPPYHKLRIISLGHTTINSYIPKTLSLILKLIF